MSKEEKKELRKFLVEFCVKKAKEHGDPEDYQDPPDEMIDIFEEMVLKWMERYDWKKYPDNKPAYRDRVLVEYTTKLHGIRYCTAVLSSQRRHLGSEEFVDKWFISPSHSGDCEIGGVLRWKPIFKD